MEEVIERLGLEPHPEGGYFRETFRSSRHLIGDTSPRSASTAIYFMLPAGAFSAFHVIHSADEIWHHYQGEPVEIHTVSASGEATLAILGGELDLGQRPQIVVPAGTLQAAVNPGARFALCGCTVTPGFDFADFAIPSRDELLARFPQHENLIRRFTR
jgi:predicted cupin superfamily sugar epimerase